MRKNVAYHTVILRSYSNSSSGVNLTPALQWRYFLGSHFNSKEFKELFFGSKNDPRYRGVKKNPKRSYPVPKSFALLSELNTG